MGVDLGGFDVFVPQELLDNANVGTLLNEMSGKAVTESVNTGRLEDFGFFKGFGKKLLDASGVIFTSGLAFEQVFFGLIAEAILVD